MTLVKIYLVLSAILCVLGLYFALRRLRSGGSVKIGPNWESKTSLVWAVVSGAIVKTYWGLNLPVIIAGGFIASYVVAWGCALFMAHRWASGDGRLILPKPLVISELVFGAAGLILCGLALVMSPML